MFIKTRLINRELTNYDQYYRQRHLFVGKCSQDTASALLSGTLKYKRLSARPTPCICGTL